MARVERIGNAVLDSKTCQHCGVMIIRGTEQKCNWDKRRFCGKPCYYASRVVNTTCVECDGKAVTRNRCETHYSRWKMQQPKLRESANENQRERHARERRELADWYLRVLYDVPADSSPGVYAALRVHAQLKRALGMGKRSRLRR